VAFIKVKHFYINWGPRKKNLCCNFIPLVFVNVEVYTRWFRYDQDDLCVNKSQFVPVIFEPPCICAHTQFYVHVCARHLRGFMADVSGTCNSPFCSTCLRAEGRFGYSAVFVSSVNLETTDKLK
jgi:hypothetical protein